MLMDDPLGFGKLPEQVKDNMENQMNLPDTFYLRVPY